MDRSDPLVLKFSLDLQDSWKIQSENESRASREDVIYQSEEFRHSTKPKKESSEYDMESALSKIMKSS